MINMIAGSTGTLSVQGIPWTYLKYNDRIGFGYGRHAIIFDPLVSLYLIKQDGQTVFSAHNVSECLEHAAHIVWDYYSQRIAPVWEN